MGVSHETVEKLIDVRIYREDIEAEGGALRLDRIHTLPGFTLHSIRFLPSLPWQSTYSREAIELSYKASGPPRVTAPGEDACDLRAFLEGVRRLSILAIRERETVETVVL